MKLGEGLDRHAVHGQGWGLQGRVWEGLTTGHCSPPRVVKEAKG